MSGFVLSDQAKCDLREIKNYLARQSPSACIRILDRINDAFELIADQPGMGERADDVIAGCRIFPVRKYVILYKEMPRGIRISRIVHGSRDLSQLFDE